MCQRKWTTWFRWTTGKPMQFPQLPITITNRLIPSFIPLLYFHCSIKNEMCWWKLTKVLKPTEKAKRGKKKIFRKEWSTIAGIINQDTRKISARWPQTVFYFCPCQMPCWMRPHTNTSALTRDTLWAESFISSAISGEVHVPLGSFISTWNSGNP